MHEHATIPIGSTLWWQGLIGSSIFWILIIIIGLYFKKKNKAHQISLILFWTLLLRELIYFIYLFATDKFTLRDSLPLHMCNISYIFIIIVLYTKNQRLFEFLLMLSLAGAIQSLLTPELTHGFSEGFFIDFYFVHAGLFFLPIYCFKVLDMRLRHRSWWDAFLLGNAILLIVGLINWILNSNYIYLCTPPKADNPFVMGGFPYHLIGFEVFGFIHIVVIYIIFHHIIPKKYPINF